VKINIIILLFAFTIVSSIQAQNLTLPEGAKTKWIINNPEEVVSYLIFNPKTVKERLPSSLRFITIKELAQSNVSWAKKHLKKMPAHSNWGIAFIEIARMKKFEIDGRSPKFPEHGAVALWFARVEYKVPNKMPQYGEPLLALDFWVPDSNYVTYMRNKGYYSSYGEVYLQKNSNGKWIGSIKDDGLYVSCECLPSNNNISFGSNATQVIYPPAQSGIKDFVLIKLADHKEQTCKEGSSWIFKGSHPLVKSIILGPTSFEYGYSFLGGTYK
jgi:hypothetical protein